MCKRVPVTHVEIRNTRCGHFLDSCHTIQPSSADPSAAICSACLVWRKTVQNVPFAQHGVTQLLRGSVELRLLLLMPPCTAQVLAEACDIDTGSLQLTLIHQTAAVSAATPAVDTPTTAAAQAALPYDELDTQILPASEPLQDLLDGKVRCVEYSGGQVFVDAPRSTGTVYLPGSFNPLHDGHRGMLQAAVQVAAANGDGAIEGCYELAVVNADKVRLLMPVSRWTLSWIRQ